LHGTLFGVVLGRCVLGLTRLLLLLEQRFRATVRFV
jgi:hypothetical protein